MPSATQPSLQKMWYVLTTMRSLLLILVLALLSCTRSVPHYQDSVPIPKLLSLCKDRPNECQNQWWVCYDHCVDKGDFVCWSYDDTCVDPIDLSPGMKACDPDSKCRLFRGVNLVIMRDIEEKYPTQGYLAEGSEVGCKDQWTRTGDIALRDWHDCQKLCANRPEYPWYSSSYPWCRQP